MVFCELCLSYLQPVVTRSLITHTYKVTVHAVGAYQDPLQFLIRRKHYKDRAAARALWAFGVGLYCCTRYCF